MDALAAAAKALDARLPGADGCGRTAHPYTGSLERWDTDASALRDVPDVRVPLAAPDGAGACPRNAAGSGPLTCPARLAEVVAKGVAEIEERFEAELKTEEERLTG
ncbi:hypothetical protein ABZ826_33160 [Streptomyces sp. NPDC047515]|uniref:hypothetical protein n=1 Tax=Streptomyces sp. NPDC047515 TaxID=3155380 RepID=UPI003410968D